MEHTLSPEEIRTLDICQEIELLCEDLYLYYAELFRDNRAIRELWLKTAHEEQLHAGKFALAARVKKGLVDAVTLKIDRAAAILTFTRTVCDWAKAHPPTLEEALSGAMKMEESLAEIHLEFIAGFKDETHRRMFTELMADDRRHGEDLELAYNTLMDRKKTGDSNLEGWLNSFVK